MKPGKATVGLPRLPILDVAGELGAALARGHVVLTAETGSGKTTLVPLLLRDASWLAGLRILLLEPRRPAARMAARRMARLIGQAVGGEVGYQTRFERRIGEHTRVEVVTEGLLLRRLQQDPELAGVGLVIFDEFHERSLVADLSLALCLDVIAGLRGDLRLLVMSASLDPAPVAALLPAEVIQAAGRTHPVELAHATRDVNPRDPVPNCLRLLEQELASPGGDVLVFLPGRREISQMAAALDAGSDRDIEMLPLYGDLPADEQDRVLASGGPRRRVILSTDIAETSLTIEGITSVIDSGLARRPRFDPQTGLTRLETGWISRASALQRAGRAGRLGPGRCLRAWTSARQRRLAADIPPEIRTADLAPAVLEVAGWGVDSPDCLAWLDPPPAAHWQQGVALLRGLGALDGTGRITGHGQAMVALPCHPRLAHMLLVARADGAQRLAANVAAILSDRDPLRGSELGRHADIGLRLDAMAAAPARAGSGAWRRELDRQAQQFMRMIGGGDAAPVAADPARSIALAYPERVAMRTAERGSRYLMRNGRAVRISDDDPLCKHRFLAVASVDAGRRDGRVWLAAAFDEAALRGLFADEIEVTRETRWEPALGDVAARRVTRLGALLLGEEPVALCAEDPVAAVIVAQLHAQGLALLGDTAADLRQRVAALRRLDGDGVWPDWSDQGLLDSVADWLLPWLHPGVGMRQLRNLDLTRILADRLGWDRGRQLDQFAPTHYSTPAGTRRRIDYGNPAAPVLAVPLQELLGCSTGPVVGRGRLPVVLHLLSPAGRPLQVTSDLAAFWRGAYAEVKKEMRGRYPKHVWPDDPASAQATRFTRHRR